jgi:hypothetical protein
MDTETRALLEKVEVKGYGRDFTTLQKLLKQLRTSKFRAPKVVKKHGTTLLNSFASSLGDDREWIDNFYRLSPLTLFPSPVWTINEQVFLAAVDVHDAALATKCFEALDRKFPGSLRVKRLAGIRAVRAAPYQST